MTDDDVSNPVASDSDLPDRLYHYTDINGLKGIWETGAIWATHSMFLNDTTELRLGALMVEKTVAEREAEIMERWAESAERELALRQAGQQIDEVAFKEARRVTEPDRAELKDIRSALEYVKGLDVYIACLSEMGDQLSQWRGYAKEGYCIGFDTKQLLDSLGEDRVARRVRYGTDSSDSNEYVERSIELAKRWREIILGAGTSDDEDRHYIMGKYMMLDAAFLKDRGFAEEKEVRIAETFFAAPDLFTPHRYGMVPRRKISIPPGAIKSVRVGPSAHEQLKVQSLFRYFTHVGFAGQPWADLPGDRAVPQVLRSTIPFRDW